MDYFKMLLFSPRRRYWSYPPSLKISSKTLGIQCFVFQTRILFMRQIQLFINFCKTFTISLSDFSKFQPWSKNLFLYWGAFKISLSKSSILNLIWIRFWNISVSFWWEKFIFSDRSIKRYWRWLQFQWLYLVFFPFRIEIWRYISYSWHS
jgi:hypothetical protein